MRKYYQRRLPSNSSKDYYYMLRNTPNNESIIVEYGFADSSGDDVNQIKNNWQELTEAVVRALADYIGVPYTPPAGSSVSPTPSNDYYIVKRGDTLYGIAQANGVTVDALKNANNLSNNNLTIGMSLVIPSTVSSSDVYVVKSGDSLYKIANMYGMSVDELKQLNNLTSNLLQIGQTLKVKSSSTTPANSYVVKSGDSLYSIAKKFGVSVDQLKTANNKTSNLLSIGEVLVIPSNNLSSNDYYVVVPGDTLYGIARKFNTTVNAIREENNLNTTVLTVGMTLKIPK